MKPAPNDTRIRPSVLLLVSCSLVAICIPLGISRIRLIKPASAAVSRETQPAVDAVRAATPAPVMEPVTATQPVPTGPSTALEEHWGIQVSRVGLTMAGAAVDLCYRVVSAEKAAALAEGKAETYLIDQASGAKILMAPPIETGVFPAHSRARMMRQGGGFPPAPNRLAAGRTNSILLPNPSGILKSGSKVTVVMGDIRVEDLVVD